MWNCCFCGLRSQELLALTPARIEPDGSAIHIRQAVSIVRGTVSISSPKTFDSYRTVVVPSTLQSMVGHSSMLMTKHYLHVHPSVQNDAVEKFSKAFPAHDPEPLDEMIRKAEMNRAADAEQGERMEYDDRTQLS